MIFFGKCFACPSSANYDKINKRCVCKTGFTGNGIICLRNRLQSIDNIKVGSADEKTSGMKVWKYLFIYVYLWIFFNKSFIFYFYSKK